MVHEAAIPTESAAYRVVTPSQAFTRKISRLIGAVAIFKDGVIKHDSTARNDEIRAESLEGRRRWWLASFLGRRGCFGRDLRCSLGVQIMLAKEPGLGILCRMPTEDLRAGPKLALLLPIKAPSSCGPAVAAKQTEVS